MSSTEGRSGLQTPPQDDHERSSPQATTAFAAELNATKRLHASPAEQAHRGAQKDALLRRLVATADVAAVLASAVAVSLAADRGLASALWWVSLLPMWVVVAKLHDLYDADHVRIRHLTADEVPALFHWATVSAAGATLILALGPARLSVAAAVVGWAVALGTALLLRFLARALWRRIVEPERGVVIGEGQLADALARKLALEPGHHLALVASTVPTPQTPDEDAPLHLLPELEETVRRERAERVVLAMPDLDEATLSRVVATCRALGVKLSVAPPLRAMLGTAVTLTHMAELPLIEFRTWDPSRSTAFLKRSMDFTLSVAALVALAPLLVLIAVLVKLDSHGPALFRQRRAGQGGRAFQLFKFRTMVRDAEARLEEVVRLEELEEPMYKLRADPRVTRVGRWLRRTSLDELPQLINVLRGEMSLVGPRPEDVRLVERYPPELDFRFEMRPGITGPMQVHGRGELTFQERVAVEREYVENYSLRKDVRILVATAATVVRGRGAF
jgi:exopolysaccharide biosynthesis polyprenyl glycosylphosphotransferase